jgi:hypothetical protein
MTLLLNVGLVTHAAGVSEYLLRDVFGILDSS